MVLSNTKLSTKPKFDVVDFDADRSKMISEQN